VNHSKILKDLYGLEGSVIPLPGYIDKNYQVETKSGEKFVLKFSREKKELLEAEALLLNHLHSLRDKERKSQKVYPSIDGALISSLTLDGQEWYVRLVSFIEGKFLAEIKHTPKLGKSLGSLLGRLNRALSDFDHVEFHARVLEWDLQQTPLSRKYVEDIKDPVLQARVSYFIQQYEENVGPYRETLRKSVIYSDANEWNVLVEGENVAGVIDFGDAVYSHTINDLAIAITYFIMGKENPVDWAIPVIQGFHEIYSLEETEIHLLYYLIGARLSISLCQSAHGKTADPGNEYLTVSEEPISELLTRWIAINPVFAENRFREACRYPALEERNGSKLLEARNLHFSKSLSLSYLEPIYMQRAAFQYMFDTRGKTYLDLVNNIMHVGHCHPKVTEAGSRQMKILNTNTRYLYDELREYSELLSSFLPSSLNKIFLVNSGSAASDLAIRLARTHTAKDNIMVMDHGYHGNTMTGIEISPYKFQGKGGKGKASWIIKAEIPDMYRAKKEGMSVEDFINKGKSQIEKHSGSIAAFIAEPIVGCGGQIPLPPPYLSHLYEAIRAQGGVAIADEVQTGFGRVGSHFWAFEEQNAIPDILVLGKPIGNGHPMGAVITTEAIARSFENGMEFFSSFGGNPVSCAIGKAVLEVIREEELQKNAMETGNLMKEELRKLAKYYPLIGDVRGSGLFLGIELIEDEDLSPATVAAKNLVNGMKERGILLSTDGPFNNVIKIKPPLCIHKDDVQFLIDNLYSELKSMT